MAALRLIDAKLTAIQPLSRLSKVMTVSTRSSVDAMWKLMKDLR